MLFFFLRREMGKKKPKQQKTSCFSGEVTGCKYCSTRSISEINLKSCHNLLKDERKGVAFMPS